MAEIPPLPLMHRTIRLPSAVWRAARKRGTKEGKSMRLVISDAVDRELMPLMDALRDLGLDGEQLRDKLVRSPVDENVLARLNHARRVTGMSAVHLLILRLDRHAKRTR